MAGRKLEERIFYISPILTLRPRHIESIQLYDRLPSFPDGSYRCQTGFNEKRVFLCLFVPSASAIQNVYTTLPYE